MRGTTPDGVAIPGVVLFASLLAVGVLHPAAARGEDDKRFKFTLIPYAWLPSTSGQIQTGPVTTSADVCITELFQNATCLFAAFGRAEAWYDRIGGYVDGGWMGIKFQGKTPFGTNVEVNSSLAVVDFGLLVKVADWPLGQKGGDARLELDAYAGGRWMYVGVDLDLENLSDRSGDRSWVDPVVGGRVIWDLNPKWSIMAGGDVGGFGVASEFTWEAQGYLAYKFPMGSKAEGALLLGYKAIGDNYQTGSGLDRFEWDVVMHGPVLGMAFRF